MMEVVLMAKPSSPSLKGNEGTIFGSWKESSFPKYVAPSVRRDEGNNPNKKIVDASINTPYSRRKSVVGHVGSITAPSHISTSSAPRNNNFGFGLNN